MKEIKFEDSVLAFSIDKSLYSESVIYKCFYWYLNDYSFELNDNGTFYRIILKNKKSISFDEEELIFRIKNDLADYKLREIINQETQNIKELIIVKALSNYEEEKIILTNVSNPIGVGPHST
ncbi:His-Xaa-Ser system protein HxsD [Chryseobacterium sp. KMC2]|uniref:His-Xaa-Ser system protein HxsD n=1 Tax=Chryseobacterium sp. KMC2 TaxID=2800705 RepID=UPI00064636FD|nr:His-Xaa-Ser system protein HxsD [Chryseobacterium sp. KMC2]MBL3546668.1 His-Xaa-Ser system protein HxsD [Chryseobacterium sp. KMC2]